MFIKKPRVDDRWVGMVSSSSVAAFLFLICGLLGVQIYRMMPPRSQPESVVVQPPLDNFSVVDDDEEVEDLQEDNFGFENPNFGASYVYNGFGRVPL